MGHSSSMISKSTCVRWPIWRASLPRPLELPTGGDWQGCGMTWETILRRRDGYRKAFASFDPAKVARFAAKRKAALLNNPGIIRNRLKIEAAVTNARAFLVVQNEFGSFDRSVWRFVGGKPIANRWETIKQVPATTPESDALSMALKQRGFRFVGSTIIYAYMQAVGLVNDHTVDCFRRR
jgi:DNA-3-methyladenine glycosylase I